MDYVSKTRDDRVRCAVFVLVQVLHHDLELVEFDHSVLVQVHLSKEVVPLTVAHLKDATEHALELLFSDAPVAVLIHKRSLDNS